MMAIHEISKLTGISVRTLRYYDEIDLLKPFDKTEGGHRLYGEEQLKKLQQIIFLKNLGFKLKEIQSLFNDNWDWAASLDHQLAFVLEEQEKLKQMETTIIGLKNALTIEGQLDETLLQQMIQLSNRDTEKKAAIRNQLFSEDEQSLIHTLPNLNRNDPHSLEWIALLGQLKASIEAGPGSNTVQKIINRMMEKINEQYSNNDVFVEKIWDVRKSPSLSDQMGLYPLDKEFLNFLEEAYAIYEEGQLNGLHAK